MKKLEVRLTQSLGQERIVGQLAESGHRIYFEYDPAFLRKPLWLSPFKLPPEPGLLRHRDLAFGPIFGLFDDSLPDGWGLLLMDRHFSQIGRGLVEVSPLDRLAFLGTRTMGALTYHPPSHPAEHDERKLDLLEMARASERLIEGSSKEVLPQLLRAGGSPGGARPKVLVGVSGETIISGEDNLREGFLPWIVKLGSRDDPPDSGPIEMAYSLMARDAGITMPPTRLFEASEGYLFFGVLRFDRRAGHRYHVHTFGNLIHSDFRVPSCDYEDLLKVTQALTKNHQDVLEIYRRMVFNVVTHNRDDHVKNFAFRLNDEERWELAPAYDLVHSPGPGGEHSMTIAGEGLAPARSHLLQLADPAGLAIREAESVIDEVVSASLLWNDHAAETQVGKKSLRTIGRAIEENLGRL